MSRFLRGARELLAEMMGGGGGGGGGEEMKDNPLFGRSDMRGRGALKKSVGVQTEEEFLEPITREFRIRRMRDEAKITEEERMRAERESMRDRLTFDPMRTTGR